KNSQGKLNYSIENGVVVLDMIEVNAESRCKGVASKLMTKFINKFNNREIELHAYPQDELTTIDRLVVFYEKFGFEVECGSESIGFEMKRK
ncbi:MAG TPA: GNAT family N-acetyltransferase, partial [Bacteroidia bacterium]